MDEENLITLSGRFTYILFRSEETFYTVGKFRIQDERERQITVTGTMSEVRTDILYTLTGRYTEHPRYGMQFVIDTYEIPLPSEREGMIRYLSGIQFGAVRRMLEEEFLGRLGTFLREPLVTAVLSFRR
jgi:exodeoxyribonuclease V alpha subunit